MTPNNPSTENLPTAGPDADTYVVAFKDGDMVKVNLPAIPLTAQQRMDEINKIITSLLTTNGGQERLAVALEMVRTFITSDAAQNLIETWARSNNTDDIPLEKIRTVMQRGVYNLRSSAGVMEIPTLITVEEINSGAAIAGWRATNIYPADGIGLPSDHGLVLTIAKADQRIVQYFYRESNGDIYYRTWHSNRPGNFRLLTGAIGLDQHEVDARVDALAGDATRLSALSVALEGLRGYVSKEQMNQLLAGIVGAVANRGVPGNLLALSRGLQIIKGDNQVWHKLNPFPEANSELVYATILGKARFDGESPLEIDAIPDQSDTLVAGVESGNIRFYDSPNNRLNIAMPGFGSHIDQTAINIHRSGRNSFLTDFRDNFIISFDYAMQRFLHAGESVDLLRFGNQAAVIGLSQQDGLYFNVGDTAGGDAVNTIVRGDLYTEAGALTGHIDGEGQSDLGVDFVVPGNYGVPLNVTLLVRRVRRDNGEYAGTYSDSIPLRDLSLLLSGSGSWGRGLSGSYVHHGGRLRFTIERQYTSEYVYIFSAQYSYTAAPTGISGGYARESLLTGDDYGGSGDFNQTRNGEIQRYLGGHVIVEMMQGGDGYMKARAVIDGVVQNGGAFIDLRRTAEDLGIDDLTVAGAGNGMFIGNEAASIARIYAIKNSRPLTLKQLLQIYNHRDNVGSIYYERRSADDKYVIPAIVQANDANGNPTTLGGGLSMDLNEDGTPKNYLTRPIITTSSSSNANQRTIPEMENALAVVVVFGEFDERIVLTDAHTETIYDRRSMRNAHGTVSIWGGASESRNLSAYGFSFPNASTIRFDSIYRGFPGGQSAGIHKVFLIR